MARRSRRRTSRSRRRNPSFYKAHMLALYGKAGVSFARPLPKSRRTLRWLKSERARQKSKKRSRRRNPTADQMVLEAISMGGPNRNLDALMDVQEAMDEGMLSDAVYDKAHAWIKGIGAARARSSSASTKSGKGKRGWIKQGGRWVATR